MLENGYVRDHRSLLTWGWFKDPFTAHLWEYLRLAANWEEHDFKGHCIARGQLVTSYPSMAEATGLSIQNVRTAIKHLKQTGEIEMKSYKDYSIITVVNYEKYQSDAQEEQQSANSQLTDNQQPSNSLLTAFQQASNSQLTTIEKSKKAKKQKGKKDIPPFPPCEGFGFSDATRAELEAWWTYKAQRGDKLTDEGWRRFLSEVKNRIADYGEDAVIKQMDLAMAENWIGTNFKMLRENHGATNNGYTVPYWDGEETI
jgi:biotin operon repressor